MTTEQYISLEDTYGASNYKPLDVILNKATVILNLFQNLAPK